MQMKFEKSLSQHILWGEALAEQLGLPYDGPALPSRTRCPLCQGQRLTIYDDAVAEGNWFCCADCRAAGDMIELAGACWRLPPDVALAKLKHAGFPLAAAAVQAESVASYLQYHVDYRRRLQQLWEDAQGNLAQSPSATLSRLGNRYHLPRDLTPERWRDGPGRLVGAATVARIEAAFVPGALQPGDRPGMYNRVGDRIFEGKGWDAVLLIPYYDLPGRISGFQFLGRAGARPADQVFHVAERRQGQGQKRHPFEAGLAWLPRLCQDCQERDFVAINDPWLALQIQVRHFGTSLIPLPLTVWQDSPSGRTTRNSWQLLQNRRVVIWSWKLDHRAVYQAIQSDGDIAVAGPDEPTISSLNDYVRHLSPADLMRRLVRRARPWREALGEWAQKVHPGTIEDLLFNLESYGVDVPGLCHDCPALRCGQILWSRRPSMAGKPSSGLSQ
jgi:hypothetical protein